MTGLFKCVKCGKKKIEQDFCKNKSNKNGLDHRCKECVAELVKASRDKKRANVQSNK